ncbi:hypothetical protein ILYODFUR_020348, partial [Ilyodon furcidens]
SGEGSRYLVDGKKMEVNRKEVPLYSCNTIQRKTDVRLLLTKENCLLSELFLLLHQR